MIYPIHPETVQKLIHEEFANINLDILSDVKAIANSDEFTNDEKINLIQSNFILAEMHEKRLIEGLAQAGLVETCENCTCGHGGTDSDEFEPDYPFDMGFDEGDMDPEEAECDDCDCDEPEQLTIFDFIGGMVEAFAEEAASMTAKSKPEPESKAKPEPEAVPDFKALTADLPAPIQKAAEEFFTAIFQKSPESK